MKECVIVGNSRRGTEEVEKEKDERGQDGVQTVEEKDDNHNNDESNGDTSMDSSRIEEPRAEVKTVPEI